MKNYGKYRRIGISCREDSIKLKKEETLARELKKVVDIELKKARASENLV
ncbi:MAG: hypothetical protein ACFFG0_24370 [Candidatus Thorarchaeota archaeon]